MPKLYIKPKGKKCYYEFEGSKKDLKLLVKLIDKKSKAKICWAKDLKKSKGRRQRKRSKKRAKARKK